MLVYQRVSIIFDDGLTQQILGDNRKTTSGQRIIQHPLVGDCSDSVRPKPKIPKKYDLIIISYHFSRLIRSIPPKKMEQIDSTEASNGPIFRVLRQALKPEENHMVSF